MNSFKLIFTTALALLLLTAVNAQKPKDMQNIEFTSEQQAVLNTINKMVTAFEKKDIKGVLATYEPNAIVMLEPQKPVTDHKILGQAFENFATVNPKFTFGSHEVYISGNIATHITPWSMTGTLPDGGEIKERGLSVAILRKQKDGEWLIIQDNPHGHYSLNN